MNSKKRNLILFIPPILCVITIFLFTCVIKFSSVPKITDLTLPIDKFVHFVMFFSLSFLILLSLLGCSLSQLSNLKLLFMGIVFPGIYGGVIELIQLNFVEGRSGEWLDLIADILGSVTATVIFIFIEGKLIKKIKRIILC